MQITKSNCPFVSAPSDGALNLGQSEIAWFATENPLLDFGPAFRAAAAPTPPTASSHQQKGN